MTTMHIIGSRNIQRTKPPHADHDRDMRGPARGQREAFDISVVWCLPMVFRALLFELLSLAMSLSKVSQTIGTTDSQPTFASLRLAIGEGWLALRCREPSTVKGCSGNHDLRCLRGRLKGEFPGEAVHESGLRISANRIMISSSDADRSMIGGLAVR